MFFGAVANVHGAPSNEELQSWKRTDDELQKQVADLDAQVSNKQAELDNANQAIDASKRPLELAHANIGNLEKEKSELTEIVQEAIIEQYVQPSTDLAAHVSDLDGMEAFERRNAIVSAIGISKYDGLDRLKAIERDLRREKKRLEDETNKQIERRDAAEKLLSELRATRDVQQRAHDDLSKRIEAALAEDSTLRNPSADSSSIQLSVSGLRWPVDGAHTVTSPFGPRWGRFHSGIDIAARTGTPIRAVKDGTVTYAGWEGGYGNYVCVQHGGGFQSCNGHNSSLKVRVGQAVRQGDLLAYSGSTGHSTGPHLHFETCASTGKSCIYGTMKNPMNFLP